MTRPGYQAIDKIVHRAALVGRVLDQRTLQPLPGVTVTITAGPPAWRRRSRHCCRASRPRVLYVNVTADHAVDTMEKVVKNIIDDPSIPGVVGAKLSGPAAVGARADSIVIYLESEEASRAVAARLKALTDANPEHFNPAAPAMTERLQKGVSAGMEPFESIRRLPTSTSVPRGGHSHDDRSQQARGEPCAPLADPHR
jgi:hypothetical protein